MNDRMYPPEDIDALTRPAGADPRLDSTRAQTPSNRTPTGAGPAAPHGQVPGYEIEGELGKGGMGVVYKARHVSLNRPVALKMMAGGDRDRIRFLAEAEAVAAVRHDNVVQVYDFGENDGRPYMSLELCAGGSLACRLLDGPLTAPTAAALLAGIAAGVAAAHGLGIVHRDLKPANVLLADGGTPKVADFGIAKRSGIDLTQTQAVMGTPAYMAPEQASGGSKFVGPPADVWALGVMLYECLAGARPFDGKTTDEVLAQVQRSAPSPLRARAPATPRDLVLICRKCLEKDPIDRYPTAAELAADLGRFVRGEPVLARRSGAWGQLRRWAGRNRTAALVSAAFAVLVVAAALTCGVFAYRAREAAEAAESRAGERDRAVFKQQRLVHDFMRFLVKDKQLSPDDRTRMAEAFLAEHPELSRDDFADVFVARPSPAAPRPAPDFGGLGGRAEVGAGVGTAAPNLFGD